MVYANWENWGMSQDEIEQGLKSRMNGDNSFQNLYKSGEDLLIKMQRDIKDTDEIPYREVTAWSNKLRPLQETLNEKAEELKSQEKISTDEKSIKFLAKLIDERENLTLNLLMLSWSRDIAERNRCWSNIPCDVDENGRMVCKAGSENLTLKDIKYLFSAYNITDHYQTESWRALSLTSERKVDLLDKEYIVDYTQCSEQIKWKVRNILHYLEEVTVVAKAKNPSTNISPQKNDDSEYEDNSMLIWKVSVTGEWENRHLVWTPYLAWEWGTNSEPIDLWIKEMPLWEWAIIQEAWSYNAGSQVESYRAEQRIKSRVVWKLDENDMNISPEDKPELNKYLDFFWWWKDDKLRKKLQELWPEKYNKFIIATENRVREVVNRAQTRWYELQHPPVSKRHIVSWLMELNLWESDFSKKVDMCMWNLNGKWGSCEIWEDLYKLIDGWTFGIWSFESEYADYLNNSILSKRQETQFLAPTTWIIKNYETPPKDNLNENEKRSLVEWLDMLLPLFEDMANDLWHTYLDYRDESCAKIIQTTRNAISNLNTWKYFSKKEIKDKVTENIKKLWSHNKNEHEAMDKVFWWNQSEKEIWYRELSTLCWYMWNEEQASRIIWKRDNEWNREFKVNNEELNKCLKNIDDLLWINDTDIQFDGNWTLCMNQKLIKIERLYELSKWSDQWESIQKELVKYGIIPESLKNNEKVRDVCENLWKTLSTKEKRMEWNSPTPEKVKDSWRIELNKLQAKKNNWNITDEDEKRLYILDVYLNKDVDLGNEVIKKTIESTKALMRYEWINDIVYHDFAMYYWNEYWTNSEIVDNIQWYWWFTLSDSNAKIFREIVMDIVISAATRYIWWWMLAFWFSASKLAISWTRLATFMGKLTKMWRAIKTWLTSSKYWAKIAKYWAKFAKYPWDFVKNLSYSTVWDFWKAIREWNNPFDAVASSLNWNIREAIKSAVSFWLWNKIPAQKVFKSLKLNLDFSKLPQKVKDGLWEIWNELIKQPVMNLTIWRKNPETWEYTNSFTWDEHMVWNIVASVFAKKYWKVALKQSVSKWTDAWFLYYYDDSKMYVQNAENPQKVADLSRDDAFESIS